MFKENGKGSSCHSAADMLCDNAVSRYQEQQSCKVARIVLLLQIVPGTKVKKVYDTIQLSRATAGLLPAVAVLCGGRPRL